MNVLLSSVGRRGYLVKYFKEALGVSGQIWGADNSPYAPGFVYCDHRVLMEEVNDSRYVDHLLDICVQNYIEIVIPLIDPELEVLSRCRDRFTEKGITVLISPPETIELSYDKYKTMQFAQQNNIACPLTVLTIGDTLEKVRCGLLNWPVIVKPRKGSASADILYCHDETQLRGAMELCPNPIIQQFIEGDEYGFDLFGGRDCRPVSVYCKKKLAMRAGETDKAISVNDPVLVEFGRRLLECLPLIGPADVDVIMDSESPKLIEINPRFGGGYPCSHMAGADFCNKIIAMHHGQTLRADTHSGQAGICMLKQDEIIRMDWEDK